MKCVMIIDTNLPIGLQVNTAAVLGSGIVKQESEIIGENVFDADENEYSGITNIPIPILTLNKNEIKEKYNEIKEKFSDKVKIIIFNDVAQKSLNYDNYKNELQKTNYEQLKFLGICIYGPKKIINKLTGNIKMLR